ncbi:hypothetical protein GCM10009599_15500 [Luteococcus peritonei]
MVFVAAADVGVAGTELPQTLEEDRRLMALLERLRRSAAVAMGMCASPQTAAQSVPKIAVVSAPAESILLDGSTVSAGECDIVVRTVSMGIVHRAIPGTAALCVATAAGIPGTVIAQVCAPSGGGLRIGTPLGVVTAAADVEQGRESYEVSSASLFRTARPLMRGEVAVEP